MMQPLSATYATRVREDEDPVAAAIRRAKPVPPEDRERMLAEIAQCKSDPSDPSQWYTDEQFQRLLARHPGAPRSL